MTADPASSRWERLCELFEQAASLTGDARQQFIEFKCADDRALRDELESLLDAPPDGDRGSFEWSPSDVLVPREDQAARPDVVVGHYRLVRLLGRGGMGEVWLAERCDDQFHHQVAVKLVKRGMDTDEIIRRFHRERQLLASLEHPNIARLFDGGATGDGLPYLVMEYVAGEPIDIWCDARRLSIDDRLRLFAKVCDAVSAAHRSLVVHRDLKPPNILVTADGTPKLLDFGIARLLSADGEAPTILTAAGAGRMLTPRYASPEQIRDEPVTTATDVYSLGVILYEILTGRTPHEITTGSPRELEEAICRVEPRRPSTVVEKTPDDTTRTSSADGPTSSRAIAAARGLDVSRLKRSLSGDLDVIILRALDKDPARRYASAEQLAADIRRYLDHRPIVARPDTLGYRTAKYVRRNRLLVTATAAVLVTLLAGLIASISQYRRAEAERDVAQQRTREAEYTATASFLANAETNVRIAQPTRAALALEKIPEHRRGWEWRYLHGLLDLSTKTLWSGDAELYTAAYTPDGSRIVFAGDDGVLRILDADSGTLLMTFPSTGRIFEIAIDSNGDRAAWLAWGPASIAERKADPSGETFAERDSLYVADIRTGRLLDPWPEQVITTWGGQIGLAFSPDGSLLATGEGDGRLRLWDIESRTVRVTFPSSRSSIGSLSFHPDGELLATTGGGGVVRLWNTLTGDLVWEREGHERNGYRVTFAPDGSWLASSDGDGTVRLWDTATGAARGFPLIHRGKHGLSISPDGSRIVSGWELGIHCWSADTGRLQATLHGHQRRINALDFAPGGRSFVSTSHDGTLRQWDADRQSRQSWEAAGGWIFDLDISANGRWIATTGNAGFWGRIWECSTGRLVTALGGEERPDVISGSAISSIAFDPAGGRVAVVSAAAVVLFDTRTGEKLSTLRGVETGERFWAGAFSIDGRHYATGSWYADPRVTLWDTETGEVVWQRSNDGGAVRDLVFSPDGTRLVSAGEGGTGIRIWDAASGRLIASLGADGQAYLSVDLSRDGALLAAGTAAGLVRIWDARSLEPVETFQQAPMSSIFDVKFSPDRTRLAATSRDGAVHLWDVAAGRETVALTGHVGTVRCLDWTDDGVHLVSGATDGRIIVRSAEPPD